MAIKINTTALKDFVKSNGMTMTEASKKMGRSIGYLSNAVTRGSMSESAYTAMCNAFRVERSAFLSSTTAAPAVSDVYRLILTYNDSKVLVQLMCGERVVSGAWAIVKEQSEIGFIQAISYAAHMMYKFAEQNELHEGELA